MFQHSGTGSRKYSSSVRPSRRPRQLVPPQVGHVEDDRDGWCALVVAADNLERIAAHTALLGFPAQVLEPPELRAAAQRLTERLSALVQVPSRSER